MRIITYRTDDESVPAAHRCVARLRAQFPAGGKRKAGEDWCPIIIYGATEDEARANAEAWLHAEIAKEQAKARNREERAERMRQARGKPQPQPEPLEQQQ